MLELVLVSTPIPMGMWLLAESKALATLGGGKNTALLSGWQLFTFETLVVLFPALASTIWPSHVTTMVLSMALSSVCCRLWRSKLMTSRTGYRAEANERSSQEERRNNYLAFPAMSFITNFRASVMIVTCITILAVDFQVFPRRFAKTEVFGTGLMDLGVGATVFASGLAAGCKVKQSKGDAQRGWSLWRAMLVDGVSAAVRAWPLAALGASRLVVVKGLDYQEHVSEYGVHWNFFATLFFLRIVVVPMNRLRPARLRHLLALVAMCVYQWWLVNGGLSDFIVHAPRDTLFSMNREGVLGLVGFVAIYYIAEELGSQVRRGHEKTKKGFTETRLSSKCVAVVTRATVILWGLTLLSEGLIQDTSRRMVNLTYVLWVGAHSTLMLSLLMLVDIISSNPSRSQILSAINFNMFPVFMVANLATGAINLSMRTLDADTSTAVMILSIYLVVVAGFAVILMGRWGFKVKV